MKTEQEQIEKMARTMCGYCSTDGKCAVSKNGREPDICANVDTEHCLYKEYAERLIESGYGDVSEYTAEIERLKSENKQGNVSKILGYNAAVELHDDIISGQPVDIDSKDFEKLAKQIRNRIISFDETVKKQAKIDVLNRLKTRHDYAIKNMGYPWDISQQIDQLIKEVENEQ